MKMKKYFLLALVVLTGIASSCKYDDDEIWDSVNNLADRVASLEAATKQMNSDISALQSIVSALQNQVSVSKVETLADGYIIHFSDGTKATIKNGANGENGKDGADGKDGANGTDGKDGADGKDAPVVGVAQENGIYYWTMTIDGKTEWLTDEDGNKLRVTGEDGKDGEDGSSSSGSAGTPGKDGETPVVAINDAGYWTINGVATTVKAKAEDGKNADSQFTSLREKEVDGALVLYIKMADETEYYLPVAASVEYTLNGTKVNDAVTLSNGTVTLDVKVTALGTVYDAEVIVEEKVKAEFNDDKTKLTIKAKDGETGEGKVVILYYNDNQTITTSLKVTI